MTRVPSRAERGAALVVGLIMLVLITVMVIAALNLGTANFRSVSNMQFREEAHRGLQLARSKWLSARILRTRPLRRISRWIPITTALSTTSSISRCRCASRRPSPRSSHRSEEELGPSLSAASTWNTVWDIEASVDPDGNAGGAAVIVHAGVRKLLTQTERDTGVHGEARIDTEHEYERILTAVLAASVVLVAQAPSRAEDIDLFVQPPGVAAGVPNVLIVLDNTANWNQAFTNEIAGAGSHGQRTARGTGGTAKFRVGLMLFTETGNRNNNVDGGYVRAAHRATWTTRTRPSTWRCSTASTRSADKSNGGKAGKTMVEAYQYYSGARAVHGQQQGQDRLHGQHQRHGRVQCDLVPVQRQRTQCLRRVTLQRPARGRKLRAQLHHLHQQRRGAGQQLGHLHATTQLQSAATAEGITGATTAIPINPGRLAGQRRRRVGEVHEEELSRPSRPTRSTWTRSPPARVRAGPRC